MSYSCNGFQKSVVYPNPPSSKVKEEYQAKKPNQEHLIPLIQKNLKKLVYLKE
ncbi:MAG: hypothetical protein ACK4ZM_04120 [bacterium]